MNAPNHVFQFKTAVREQVSLLIALAGASGSGKTYSALLLAQGMSPSGKIAFIDAEARRGLHYADKFQFMHADMRPPFRPSSFIEGVRAAEDAGAEVVIIDSFSHEYDGEGGIMDWADALEASGTKSPGNWKLPKHEHKKMMNAMLQCRASLIFCLRADEKIKISKEGGRTVVVPLGWQPICEKRFMYEMTASFTLTPDNPGVPHFDLPHKLQDQHRSFFLEGEKIGARGGQKMADWARGGPAEPKAIPASDALVSEVLAEGKAQADKGTAALKVWWQTVLTKAQRLALKDHMPEWKLIAEEADGPDVGFDEPALQGAPEPTGEGQHEAPLNAGIAATIAVKGSADHAPSQPKDGGVASLASPSGPDDDDGFPGDSLLERGRSKAMQGRKAFDKWLGGLSEGDHAGLKLVMGGLIAAADAADGRA